MMVETTRRWITDEYTSTGTLRASHRNTLNKTKSTASEPFYDHVSTGMFGKVGVRLILCALQDRSDPIAPGTIVPLTIGIWPTGMVLEAGESIVLRVAGHSLVLPEVRLANCQAITLVS